MKRFVLAFNVLFWMFGCGGDGGGGPTTPTVVPDIAGAWSGTETCVVILGGTECDVFAEDSTLTASPMFNVTQNRQQIEIFQFVNCVICQYTGTIAADGSFTATGADPTTPSGWRGSAETG